MLCFVGEQVAEWFLNPEDDGSLSAETGGKLSVTFGLPVCRAKNLFAPTAQDVKHGYRDLKLFVLFSDRYDSSPMVLVFAWSVFSLDISIYVVLIVQMKAMTVCFSDLLVCSRELPVIGEIQIHDRQLFDFKHRLHRLYTVARASSIDQV